MELEKIEEMIGNESGTSKEIVKFEFSVILETGVLDLPIRLMDFSLLNP